MHCQHVSLSASNDGWFFNDLYPPCHPKQTVFFAACYASLIDKPVTAVNSIVVGAFVCSFLWLHYGSDVRDLLIVSVPRCGRLTVPCGWTYRDCSVGRKIQSFMIRVERMGLAHDFVKLTITVAENHQMRPLNMERVRIQRNRILFRLR